MWKDIPGYEGFYEVSTSGEIRRVGGKVLKSWVNKFGYHLVDLSVNNKVKHLQVHRLVMLTFDPLNEKDTVNHLDGDKSNNSLDNLEWATHAENNAHARSVGLWTPPRTSKLTNEDALEIIQRLGMGEKQKDLAKEYGLSPQAINDMWKGRTWEHLK